MGSIITLAIIRIILFFKSQKFFCDALPMKSQFYASFLLLILTSTVFVSASPLILREEVSEPTDFPIVMFGKPAVIHVDEQDAEVVRIAGRLLAEDIKRVSGVKPKIVKHDERLSGPVIIIGTLGKSRLLTDLINEGKLDGESVEGKWESFRITTVVDPLPGVEKALVIAGSDRRGTAYGALEVSRTIGVSPWVWWADVPPQKRKTLVLSADMHTEGPPFVKYRGIFINDEDWGIQPWAAKTFESETNDIGPKTYAKVCELLLRLRANYLWPAMHPSTRAFNHYPENKLVADRFAIVMGSSHAEPMLRNNVDEWDKRKYGDWNPVTNLNGVSKYWEERVRENGEFENVYTLGMRGIHDSGMPGGGSLVVKRNRLEEIIGLQRELLSKYVEAEPSRAPQIFCPYKEVLDIYQTGMDLPHDVTIVWPDDNYGYIRQLPNAQERQRPGGHGIYYHISYWGRPHDYLWLDSTAPALIWYEMTKAYQLGARRLWVVNVGDIKPCETGMSLFLEMAWNVNRYGPDVQKQFLREFYTQQFGNVTADRIADVKDEYYRLCAIRRPEHMGFNQVYPNTPVQGFQWPEGTCDDATHQLLNRWLLLAKKAKTVGRKLPEESRDAYFQLVEYPVLAAAAMAEKIILAEQARQTGSIQAAHRAEVAFQSIQQLTRRYNTQNRGKWQHMMDYRPRGLPVYGMPSTGQDLADASKRKNKDNDVASTSLQRIHIELTKFIKREDRNGVGWRTIEGLGPRGAAIALLPSKDTPTLRATQEIHSNAPLVEYPLHVSQGGKAVIAIESLPTHSFTPAHNVLAAVSINDGDPELVHFEQGKSSEMDEVWQKNVLSNSMFGKVTLEVPAGSSRLKLWAADPGVVVQSITVVCEEDN